MKTQTTKYPDNRKDNMAKPYEDKKDNKEDQKKDDEPFVKEGPATPVVIVTDPGPDTDVKPFGDEPPEDKKEDLFIVLDGESGAVEYGPSPDKDAANVHLDKMLALDARGELSNTVHRDLRVYKLVEVKQKS